MPYHVYVISFTIMWSATLFCIVSWTTVCDDIVCFISMMAMCGAAIYLCHLLITAYVATLCKCRLPVVHRWLYTMSPLSACCYVLLYDVTLCLFIFLRTTHHAILWLHYLLDILTQCTLCLHQHSDYHVRSYITSGSSYQWSCSMWHYVCLSPWF